MQMYEKRELPDGSISARKDPCKYPKADAAIKECGSVRAFTEWAGIHEMTYYRLQSDVGNPTKHVIDKVLEYTGKSYEELFGE